MKVVTKIKKTFCPTNQKAVNPDFYSTVIVQTIEERNQIACSLRQNGMIATVIEENYTNYRLVTSETIGLCNNDAWENVGNSGGGSNYIPGHRIDIDTTDPFEPIINVDDLYKGNTPSTVAVGNLPIGSDLSLKTFDDLFEEIYAPFISPTFSSFSISGIATAVEKGTSFTGNYNFIFSLTQSPNIKPNSLVVTDSTANTILVSGLPVVSPQSINIGSITANNTWTIKAENIKGIDLYRSVSVNFYDRRFYGVGPGTITTSAQTRALPQTALDNASTTFILNTGNTGKDFYVILPASRSIIEVFDLETNANVTDQYILESSVFQVQNIGGTPSNYKKYKMSIAVPFSSNHRHEIKIS